MKLKQINNINFWHINFFTSLILIPIILILNLNFILIFLSAILLHLKIGLETIIKDYIHSNNNKIISFILIRLINIYIYYFIFEFII